MPNNTLRDAEKVGLRPRWACRVEMVPFHDALIGRPPRLHVSANRSCRPCSSSRSHTLRQGRTHLPPPASTPQPEVLTVTFSSKLCDVCGLRGACTKARKGNRRSVSIAPDERLQKKLRDAAKTKSGRQRFRERVPVEHRLAHISQRQGNTARYRGTRKNLLDLRRAAAIQNLETAQRLAS